MKKRKSLYPFIGLALIASFFACNDKGDNVDTEKELSEEYYTGGILGTSFDDGILAYEQPTPRVIEMGMSTQFKYGEAFFEKQFTTETSGVRHGLGPAYVRSSCISCHPSYGHGRRMERYRAKDHGNGYLLVITDQNDNYVTQVTGMPQTQAVAPFLPPIDESGITIAWKDYVDEFGNQFPDGEKYSLIYPDVTIVPEAFNVEVPADYKVRLEATIGVYGTGLLDAIHDDSLLAEYNRQKAKGRTLNDAKYQPENFIKEVDGTSHPGRYTYGLSRGTLQNGPGANAIWNITNVTRSDRRKHYITTAYAEAMSKNKVIQSSLGQTEEEIYDYLMSQELTPELSDQEYIDFMVWHRGLAVPAARNLDDETVKLGKEKFYAIGCTECHKPSWTTGPDNYSGDPMVKGKLPTYPYQKIWPYTDLLQHRLEMVNDIRTGWCRTTPLWGRGLSQKVTGASEHLHDMRARNYTEAIMWHGGDGKYAREKFRNLSKDDRDAVVKFLESI